MSDALGDMDELAAYYEIPRTSRSVEPENLVWALLREDLAPLAAAMNACCHDAAERTEVREALAALAQRLMP